MRIERGNDGQIVEIKHRCQSTVVTTMALLSVTFIVGGAMDLSAALIVRGEMHQIAGDESAWSDFGRVITGIGLALMLTSWAGYVAWMRRAAKTTDLARITVVLEELESRDMEVQKLLDTKNGSIKNWSMKVNDVLNEHNKEIDLKERARLRKAIIG
jgi:hypothetical protein